MNLEFSSSFRTYSDAVPSFLHNRPRRFVKHCLEKLDAASKIPPENIPEVSKGILKVKSSHIPRKKEYTVSLDENSFPDCECEDWQRFYLPCKHMFSVIIHLPNYPFEVICKEYRDSPYFTLDDALLTKFTTNSNGENKAVNSLESPQQILETPEVDTAMTDLDEGVLPDLPLPKKGLHLSTAANCRDLLHQIRGLTYLVADSNILQSAETTLEKLLEDLKCVADRENGFLLEETEVKKKTSIRQKSKQTVTAVNKSVTLPLDKNLKSNKRRYGKRHETMLASKNFKMIDEGEVSGKCSVFNRSPYQFYSSAQ